MLQPGRNIAVCDVFLKENADSHSALADIVYRDHDGVVVAEMIGGRSMAVRLKGGERPMLATDEALVRIRPRRNGPPDRGSRTFGRRANQESVDGGQTLL